MWGVGSLTQDDSPSRVKKVPVWKSELHCVSGSEQGEKNIQWVKGYGG